MTVIETDAAPGQTAVAAVDASPVPAQHRGLAGILGSGDHKVIARLWIITSLLFLLVAGVAGALLGAERIDTSELDVLGDAAPEVFSLHTIAGVFLFLYPLLIGIATLVVPLQVGASTVAFPRAAAAAYWTYLVSGGVVIAAFAADGGPFGTDTDFVELFVAAMVPLLAAFTLAAICIATTGIGLRAPGMNLRRAPLYTWASIVASSVWILTLPVLAGLMVLVYVDLRYGPFFLGGSDGVYPRIAWMIQQPALYAAAIPVLGIACDIAPVAARTRFSQHGVAAGAIGACGFLAIGTWAMPGFSPSGGVADIAYLGEIPYFAFAVAIGLPVLIVLGLVGATLARGRAKPISPLVWAVSGLLMVLAGVGNGVLVSIESVELTVTTGVTSQAHFVLVGALLGAFAGIAFWAPKLLGRRLAEGTSVVLAFAGLLGTIVLALPDLISGLLDQGRFLGSVDDDVSTIEALNTVSLIGGGLLLIVALGFIALVIAAAASKDTDEADPWEGNTLEWLTASPPALGNFTAPLPEITSEAPVYDARYASEAAS